MWQVTGGSCHLCQGHRRLVSRFFLHHSFGSLTERDKEGIGKPHPGNVVGIWSSWALLQNHILGRVLLHVVHQQCPAWYDTCQIVDKRRPVGAGICRCNIISGSIERPLCRNAMPGGAVDPCSLCVHLSPFINILQAVYKPSLLL